MLPGELNKFSLFSDAVQEANATDLRVSILRAGQVMVCSIFFINVPAHMRKSLSMAIAKPCF